MSTLQPPAPPPSAAASLPHPAAPAAWQLFLPKIVTVLREGYTLDRLRNDALAGLTVAIVALPLAMALAIASGVGPERGLYTAIVAGFLISALGGSRVQIGGPTGAFVVVVFGIVAKHGYDGLAVATILAGLILIAAGLVRLGTVIKYIPYPVVTGFTAGIAAIIFTSQVKDLLGLRVDALPADFLPKWGAIFANIGKADPASCGVAALSLGLILAVRRFAPKLPAFLIGVVAGSIAVWALGLPIDTIGSRFGGIPSTLPAPSLPAFTLPQIVELLPSAATIAFLSGIESLLCAVVADGMTGGRHRSNCELVAEGVANIASIVFGGIPATGAIARTATNVKSGGRTPFAGIFHALFIALFMLALAPLARYVPLASLGAVLVMVAWNMSEIDRFLHLMAAPWGDRVLLLSTFGLTVLVDLTVAIQVGIVLAAIIFAQRMSAAVAIESNSGSSGEDVADVPRPPGAPTQQDMVPDGVAALQITGPLFFAAASRLEEILERAHRSRVVILRMRLVPLLDASGVHALSTVIAKCRARGIDVILSGVQDQPRRALTKMGVAATFAADFDAALEIARERLAAAPATRAAMAG